MRPHSLTQISLYSLTLTLTLTLSLTHPRTLSHSHTLTLSPHHTKSLMLSLSLPASPPSHCSLSQTHSLSQSAFAKSFDQATTSFDQATAVSKSLKTKEKGELLCTHCLVAEKHA